MDPQQIEHSARTISEMGPTGFLQVLITLALALGAYMGYRSDQRAQATTKGLLHALNGDPEDKQDTGLKGSMRDLADSNIRQTQILDGLDRRTAVLEAQCQLSGRRARMGGN